MKTFLQTSILVLSLALGLQTNVKAQLVFIPDSGFRAFLNYNYPNCMVGDSIDPTCSSVLTVKNVVVSNWNIADLTGIEVFVNDSALSCKSNLLTSLPTLPSFLQVFKCSQNNITSLPTLPSTLRVLDCSNNDITALPTLPNSLKELGCGINLLSSLPVLPPNLEYLYCSSNSITKLPTLNDSLKYLYCLGNDLTSLPTLPNSLLRLDCAANLLTNLPTLSDSLRDLRCGSNQITVLPTLPSKLNYFNCSNNPISNLVAFPDSLINLICNGNQLTSLPALPNKLRFLYCNNNQLSNLPALSDSLIFLYCYNNPITCLPNLKNVQNIDFSNTLVNCIPSYGVVGISNPLLSTVPLCDIFNSNGCEVLWNVEGNCYKDIDSNCVIGVNDLSIVNQKINLYKGGVLDQISYSNPEGDFSFNTTGFGVYKTVADTIGFPFTVTCPSSGFYRDTINATDSLKYGRDFGLKCLGPDLAVTSIYTANLRPARIRLVNIQAGDFSYLYGAHCADGVSGTVTIKIFGPAFYYTPALGALVPNSISGNGKTIKYFISDFGALSYNSTFDFNLFIDTTAQLFDQICFTVSISTPVVELSCNNNQLKECFQVTQSLDPNDKAVYPTTTLDISGNKWLNYTVRFQNTGTASAENIYITDTLSNKLDVSTFTLQSYSNFPFIQLYNNGLLIFNFPNINLPDSNSNEPESHGYVQFKIRAKDSLTVGSTIENTANIYFDYNAPVITNTVSNTLINCNIPTTILNATICNGEAYTLNDLEYYNAGVYQQSILTKFGCDSVVELRLTVNTINNNITQTAGTLQTTAIATNYQWINCATGTAIVGANTQTYNPTQSGNYAVVVDFGTCKDTSSCYNFSAVGINEINSSNISIQPNPFNNELKITLDKNYNGVIEVYNTIGEIITTEKLQSKNVTINTSTWNAGVYILKVATNDGVVVKKVVKR